MEPSKIELVANTLIHHQIITINTLPLNPQPHLHFIYNQSTGKIPSYHGLVLRGLEIEKYISLINESTGITDPSFHQHNAPLLQKWKWRTEDPLPEVITAAEAATRKTYNNKQVTIFGPIYMQEVVLIKANLHYDKKYDNHPRRIKTK